MPKFCRHCGAAVKEENSTFCRICGKPLTGAAPTSQESQREEDVPHNQVGSPCNAQQASNPPQSQLHPPQMQQPSQQPAYQPQQSYPQSRQQPTLQQGMRVASALGNGIMTLTASNAPGEMVIGEFGPDIVFGVVRSAGSIARQAAAAHKSSESQFRQQQTQNPQGRPPYPQQMGSPQQQGYPQQGQQPAPLRNDGRYRGR